LPGQRIIVLISPGFVGLTPAAEQAKSRAIDVAAEFNVTIDCLDTRGLDTQMEDESKLTDSLVLDQFVKHSRTAHGATMAQLATGTGGTYFHDSNDFEGGLQSLMDPPQYRYVIQFSPKNNKQDDTFHKIKVKVNEKHVTVHARASYFAKSIR
jgi:VWFA-related protein